MSAFSAIGHPMGDILRALAQWIIYGGLIALALALLLFGRAEPELVERVRAQVSDVMAPALDLISRPVEHFANVAHRVEQWWSVNEELDRLRDERAQLLKWQAIANQLESENADLRRLLNAAPDRPASSITARVVGDATSAFAQSLLINAGSAAGVDKGHVVMASEGLVGRIASAGPRSAIVLLITDLNFRAPVVVGPSRINAVLAGDNTDYPRLIHVVANGAVQPGDLVVTSGVAGGFPPGLPVGAVAATEAGLRVEPFIDRSRLQFVRVIDHQPPDDPTAQSTARSRNVVGSGHASR